MSSKGAPVISFLAGALVGAAVALLYAPSSGEELRHQIRTEAEHRLDTLNEELNVAIAELRETVEKTRAEMMAYVDQLQGAEEELAAEVAEQAEQIEAQE